MAKENCWELMKCGREPGGKNVDKLGVCCASTMESTDGINCGNNGGRACWAIAGTLCEGEVQGSFAMKLQDCKKCAFYKKVKEEEGIRWQNAKIILEKLEDAA